MPKILVTGAAGFIGSNLCKKFIKNGHSVIGIDGFLSNYSKKNKISNIESILKSNLFSFYEINILKNNLHYLFEDIETIFHLAALPGINHFYNSNDYFNHNYHATRILLDYSIKAKIKHFFYISTSSVYGKYVNGDENLKTNPCSIYGYTKYISEKLCLMYNQKYNLPISILRYFSVYGPMQRPDMAYYRFIDHLTQNKPIELYGNGLQKRTNTYIDDCINATFLAYENKFKLDKQIINVAGNETFSMKEVIDLISSILDCKPNIIIRNSVKGDQSYTYSNIEKAYNLLGYKPLTTLAKGILNQINWQLSNSLLDK